MGLADFQLWGDLCRHQASRFGEKTAFINADGAATSFVGFDRRVNQLNNALKCLGLEKNDRVAVLSKNRTEYVEIFGIAKTGLITVPLNWRLTSEELLRVLEHCQPKVIVVDEQHLALLNKIKDQLPFVNFFVLYGEETEGWVSYEQLLSEGNSVEPACTHQLNPDDIICLTYTSGTTGSPKGVGITHRGILGNARTSAEIVLKLTPEDRTLAAMPFFHVGGMWYHLHASYAAGCTSIIMSGFDPGLVLKNMETYSITNVHLVPTMIGTLLENPEISTKDLSKLRLIFYAASSIPVELLKRALATFKDCNFVQSYGSTEAGMLTNLSPDDHIRAIENKEEYLLSSCGRAAGENKLRIVDDSGASLPVRSVGEIEINGPSMMSRYWNNPEATSKVMHGGWLKSGDLGYLDANGYLYLVDRKNDMIVTGGENVYPSEVEEVLYSDPAIYQASVFGIPDPLWVEKVVAVVVLKDGCETTPEAIIQRAKQHLAGYKCPKEVFIKDQLPMNAVGKILKKDLKQSYSK